MRLVIRFIQIKNFRGFLDFGLGGLANLTVLTGRNGCGKSSVLDALMIGAAPDFLAAIGQVVQRHPLSKDGARWLFKQTKQPIDIRVETSSAATSIRRLRFFSGLHADALRTAEKLKATGSTKPFRLVSAYELEWHQASNEFGQRERGFLVFDLDGKHERERTQRAGAFVTAATLIDPALFQDLSKSFTKAVQQGHRQKLQDLLRSVLPDLISVQILTEDDDSSNLYLEWQHGAVPLSFSGDGIAAMLQIAIEAVLIDEGGLVLIEEPEVFLHPRGISAVAGFLLELMRQGRQVIITTHSLELIDSLLGRSEQADLDRMSLINLRPAEGDPTYVAWPGRQIEYVREKIGDDLR